MCGKPRAIQAGEDHFARRPGQEEASGSRPREALAGGPEGGGAMRKRKWLAGVALLAAVTLVAAACSKKATTSGGGSATSTCAADKFGCDIYKAGEPIKLGTLLSISGSTAFLGTDSQHGAQLALDYLDGKLDGKLGTILGHSVTMQNEDDGCSKDGGQAGATKLVSVANLVAVIGTSCSSAALGV